MKTNINRNLPNENYEAAISANGPTVANPYATLADVSAGTPSGNQLISGGAVYSGTGLDFDVSALEYIIAGINYTTAPTTVTLNPGDPTNPRFDAIVADDTGTVSVVQGTPAATPNTPAIGEDQVLVQYVLIGTNATTPTITTEYVYREGSSPDWTFSVNGTNTTANFLSTTPPPYQGTECVLADIGRYGYTRGVRFSTGTPVSRADYVQLSFWVYLTVDLIAAGRTRGYVFAYADNAPVSADYLGFARFDQYCDFSLVGQWQLVSLPTALFAANLGTNTTIGFLNFTLYPNLSGFAPTEIAFDDIKLSTGYGPSTNVATIDVLENDTVVGDTARLNFIDGTDTTVSVIDDDLNNKIDVSIDRPFEIEDGGVQVEPTVSGINFTGAGVNIATPGGVNPTVTVNIPGGGAGSVTTENTVYVSKNGNDGTGVRNDAGLPFLTIGAAITASLAGDAILVSPGTYAEEGLTLAGRSLIGVGGWEHTVLGVDPALATTNIITLDTDSYLQGFGINVPQTAFCGINCTQAGGTNSVYDISFYGDGGTGTSLGCGIVRQGGGKTIGANIRTEKGGIDSIMKVVQGVLALEGIHIPQSQGDVQNGLLITTDDPTGVAPTVAGRAQIVGFNSGKGDNGPFGVGNGVLNAIKLEGGNTGVIPTCIVFTTNIFNCVNAVEGQGQYERIELLGGRIENVTYAVKLDLGGNAQENIYRINANHQPNYLYNQLAAALSEFSLNFTQEKTDVFNSSYNVFGADQMSVGFSERGTDFFTGRGAPYTTGMVAFQTDVVATPATGDGTAFTDVTDDLKSRAGSLVSFLTNSPNETILIGTQRRDIASNFLRFYGYQILTATGQPNTEILFEIWDGVNWVVTNHHNTAKGRSYSYGNTIGWRSNLTEMLRPNIDSNTKWFSKTINGVDARWARLRLRTPAGSSPAFEQIKLIESSTDISKDGIPSGLGLAMFRKNISLNGPIWTGQTGAGGGLADVSTSISAIYDHRIKDSLMDGTGDEAMIQLPIPVGTCTAFPLRLRLDYKFRNPGASPIDPITPPQITVRTTLAKLSGTPTADSGGSPVPTKRSFADSTNITLATPNTTVVTLVPEGAIIGTTTYNQLEGIVHELELTNIDVSDFYEDDLILIQLEFTQDDGTTAQDIELWSLSLLGVTYQDGAEISV
jgi:hypothetical protein